MRDNKVKLSIYALRPRSESEEDCGKYEFDEESSAVDRDHEKTVRMDEREAVEGPHCAIEHGCDVRIRLKFLHCFVLPYFRKSWSAINKKKKKKSHITNLVMKT